MLPWEIVTPETLSGVFGVCSKIKLKTVFEANKSIPQAPSHFGLWDNEEAIFLGN